MDVSVITVTWNSVNFIATQLASVQAGCLGLAYEQIVVDNGSTDKTVDIVKNQFPQVKLLDFKENKGFGAANNIAAKQSSGRYFLLLNPDMKVIPGSIGKSVAWADANPRAGIIGVKLVKSTGEINLNTSPRRFPSLSDALALNLKISWLFPSMLQRYMARDLDLHKAQSVDSVQGSFMLVRRELFEKLGHLFDERYFIWYEDVDLCQEVKRLGYEVWYNPIIECIDYGSQSFKLRRPLWKQNIFIKSQVAYFEKWGPWYAKFILLFFKPVSLVIALVRTLFV
jgi:hypothetical protein